MGLSGEEQLVESLGLYFERLGFPRIAGRIIGLLVTVPGALPLDDIAERLRVSRASVSTNTRQLVGLQLIEEVAIPGDRRSFFAFSANLFGQRLSVLIGQLDASVTLFEASLPALAENPVARERLQEGIAFHRFLKGELQDAFRRWQKEKGT